MIATCLSWRYGRSCRLALLCCCLAVVLACASGRATADMAAGNATVTIELPIAVTRAADLSFSQSMNNPIGAITVTPVEAVETSMTPNQSMAASFTINGGDHTAFSITLPDAVLATNGHDTLLIDDFSADVGSTGTLEQNQCTVRVGAKLHLTAEQASGIYLNTFNIMVAYD